MNAIQTLNDKCAILNDSYALVNAGYAINTIDTQSYTTSAQITMAESLKLPLLRVIATNADMKPAAQKTLDALTFAISYAKGDKSAQAKYRRASKQASALMEKLYANARREAGD
ncbi:hypothetical protein ABIA69_002720 [Lysinibacillus parviboronicapiens]|uniref:Uncharacterized protein n=1 Tax=Lysinibacillus parviboronicapiens TaxID=436516 RepID=A0ABV2PKU7_9BACI